MVWFLTKHDPYGASPDYVPETIYERWFRVFLSLLVDPLLILFILLLLPIPEAVYTPIAMFMVPLSIIGFIGIGVVTYLMKKKDIDENPR